MLGRQVAVAVVLELRPGHRLLAQPLPGQPPVGVPEAQPVVRVAHLGVDLGAGAVDPLQHGVDQHQQRRVVHLPATLARQGIRLRQHQGEGGQRRPLQYCACHVDGRRGGAADALAGAQVVHRQQLGHRHVQQGGHAGRDGLVGEGHPRHGLGPIEGGEAGSVAGARLRRGRCRGTHREGAPGQSCQGHDDPSRPAHRWAVTLLDTPPRPTFRSPRRSYERQPAGVARRRTCLVCNHPLTHRETGRPRTYCSLSCRSLSCRQLRYRRRRKLRQREEALTRAQLWATTAAPRAQVLAAFPHITLDVAATSETALTELHIGPDQADPRLLDALDPAVDWAELADGGACWMNSPYRRGALEPFLAKAVATAARSDVIGLIPYKPNERWWIRWVRDTGARGEAFPGRLSLTTPTGHRTGPLRWEWPWCAGRCGSARFPSAGRHGCLASRQTSRRPSGPPSPRPGAHSLS